MTNPSSPFSHLNLKLKKQLEILLIISTKSVILTKNKNNNSSQIRTLVVSCFLDGTRLDLSKTKKPKTRINTGLLAHFRVEKRSKYMKATGIVRRIEEYGIIGQNLS